MDALIACLGYVDAERFIALISRDPFDYTEWRSEHLGNETDIGQLSQKAQEYSKSL